MTKNKIIDFHQHLAPSLPVDTLSGILDELRIEKSVIMPYPVSGYDWHDLLKLVGMNEKPDDYVNTVLNRLPRVNGETYRAVKNDSHFLFVPWISVVNEGSDVNPYSSPIVKVIPIFDQVTSLQEYYDKLTFVLYRVPVKVAMIHSGWGSLLSNEQYPLVRELIRRLPKKKIVICHMKEDTDDYNLNRIKLLKEFENVYVETSYCPSPHRIQQYVELGFGDRMLFGSDFRTLIHTQTLKWFIAMIDLCEIAETSKRAILYGNANRLLEELVTCP